MDDMTAGHKAGAVTVLLANEDNAELKLHEHTRLWISTLDTLIPLLERGLEEGLQERGN